MSNFHQLSRAVTFTMLLVITGCGSHGRHHLLSDECLDIPPGNIPLPPGTYTHRWQTTQEQLAEREDYVVYQNEWLGESEKLSPFGVRHVAGLLGRGPLHPIVVQASGNQTLDEERRFAMVTQLEAHGVANASQNVIVGNAMAEGLYGEEAPMLRQGYLRGSMRRGGFGNGGGGRNGGGGFGGNGRGFGGRGIF